MIHRGAQQTFCCRDGVEDAHAADKQALDHHHRQESSNTRLDEREADGKDRAQPTGQDHDSVATMSGDQPLAEAGTHKAAERRHTEGETVLPSGEVILTEQEHGQERTSRHDQAVDGQGVEEQAA